MTRSSRIVLTLSVLIYLGGVLTLALIDSLLLYFILVVMGLALALLARSKVTKNSLALFGPVILLILAQLIFYSRNLDILVGPDEKRYFEGFYLFSQHPWLFLRDAFSQLVETRFILTGSYNVFGLICYPIFWLSGDYRPEIGPLFNVTLLFAVASILIHRASDWRIVGAILALFCAPQMLYHANIFAKDVLVLIIISFSLFFLVKKKWVLALVALAVATSMRPYSIVVLFIYYGTFYYSAWVMHLAALVSVLVCAAFVNEGWLNVPLAAGYLVVSPNPFSFQVVRHDYLPLYFEAWVLLLVLFWRFTQSIRSRVLMSRFALFGSGLIIYASVMVLLGGYGAEAYGLNYEVGGLVGNVVRKKLMIAPLVYLFLFCLLSPGAKNLPAEWKMK